MDKRIKIMFILSIIIVIIVIFCINILIKNYEKGYMFSAPTLKINKQAMPDKNKEAIGPQEERPEREPPIRNKEPLLN